MTRHAAQLFEQIEQRKDTLRRSRALAEANPGCAAKERSKMKFVEMELYDLSRRFVRAMEST